jgi:hypothetical protein
LTDTIYLEGYTGHEPFVCDEILFHKGLEPCDDGYVLGDGYAIVIKGTEVYVLVAQNGEYHGAYELGDFYDIFVKDVLKVAKDYQQRYTRAMFEELDAAIDRMRNLWRDRKKQ